MPVHPACGLGRHLSSQISSRGSDRVPQIEQAGPWSGPWNGPASCLAVLILALVLGACTSTRVNLTAKPQAMESIETVYVIAGTESALDENLGGEKDSRDFFNFTETLRLRGTQAAGALAFLEIRQLAGDELTEAQEAAEQRANKALPSKRWRVSVPSDSDWMKAGFDRHGDAINVKLAKSGFTLHPELALAIIVGTTEDGDSWTHYCTRIPNVDLMPGGFLCITRGKRLTFDLKAGNQPERVLDSAKLRAQEQP